MKTALTLIVAVLLSSCVRDPGVDSRKSPEVRTFGTALYSAWTGKGTIRSSPRVQCESVNINIESLPNSEIKVSGLRIICAEKVFLFQDRILKVDTVSGTTLENGSPVGRAPNYIDSSGSGWFNFKIEIPELGAQTLYMGISAAPAGTFTDKIGPVLFLDINTDLENGTNVFYSTLDPAN